MRVLSGIQPTGRPHWGNYFGAIRQYIDLQTEHEGFYFIADLHALTTVRDAETLRQNTIDAALDIAILQHGKAAADILAYDSQIVPVGQDQVQHIEVCRDLAGTFNHEFGDTFVLPMAKTLEHGAKVPGTDGQKKSKSYNNTLPLFGDDKSIRKAIMRITTDSRPMEQGKEPDEDHLFQLYRLFASAEDVESMAAMYRRGGFGYGEVKKAVAEASEAHFAEARARRADFERNLDFVHRVLCQGALRAREVAGGVLARAQKHCGLR